MRMSVSDEWTCSVLTVAGKDATTVFFSLHRLDVLLKPQYERLVIGQIEGESPRIRNQRPAGQLSEVPYGEPNWLTPAFSVPYYNDSHRALQREMRLIVDELLKPEAHEHEMSGKKPTKEIYKILADKQINHMRLGPGKHLHGLTLLGGVKGEDFDYFQ